MQRPDGAIGPLHVYYTMFLLWSTSHDVRAASHNLSYCDNDTGRYSDKRCPLLARKIKTNE